MLTLLPLCILSLYFFQEDHQEESNRTVALQIELHRAAKLLQKEKEIVAASVVAATAIEHTNERLVHEALFAAAPVPPFRLDEECALSFLTAGLLEKDSRQERCIGDGGISNHE